VRQRVTTFDFEYQDYLDAVGVMEEFDKLCEGSFRHESSYEQPKMVWVSPLDNVDHEDLTRLIARQINRSRRRA
jgi:hypothetical protein